MYTTGKKIIALALIYVTLALAVGCGGSVARPLPPQNLKVVWPAVCTVQYAPPYFACYFMKPTSAGGYFQGDTYQFLHTFRDALEAGLPSSPSGADATFEFPTPVSGGTTASIWGNVNFVAPAGHSEVRARVTAGATFLLDVHITSLATGVCAITVKRADGAIHSENTCSMTLGQMFFPVPLAGPPISVSFKGTTMSGAGTFSMKLYGSYATPPPSFVNATPPPSPSTLPFPGCTYDPVTDTGACTGTSIPPGKWGRCEWRNRLVGTHLEGDVYFDITALTDPFANCPFPFPRPGIITAFGRTVGYAPGSLGLTSSSLDVYSCVALPLDGNLCFNEVLGGMKIGIQPNFKFDCSIPDPGSCTILLGNFDGTPITYRTAIPAAGLDGGLNVDLPESLPNRVHVHYVVELQPLAP